MPIVFVTGLPGAGKSLRAVQRIVEAREQGRNVYVCGLDGLDPSVGAEIIESPNDWQDLPDGSLVVVDEAQKWWPQRRAGDPAPYIRALSEHRHRGFDFLIVTQHPSMVDKYVRTLCGEHEHVLRQFGLRGAKIVTWQECYDDPQSQATRDRGTIKPWAYPKRLFTLYKSATLHTVKARIPLRMKVIPLIVLAVAVAAWYGWKSVDSMAQADMTEQARAVSGVTGMASAGPAGGGEKPKYKDAVAFAEAFTPRIPGAPWSAPAFDSRQVVSQPELYCIATERLRCICHTEQGTRYAIEPMQCLQIVRNGVYNPFRQPVLSDQVGSETERSARSDQPPVREYVELPSPKVRATSVYPSQDGNPFH